MKNQFLRALSDFWSCWPDFIGQQEQEEADLRRTQAEELRLALCKCIMCETREEALEEGGDLKLSEARRLAGSCPESHT